MSVRVAGSDDAEALTLLLVEYLSESYTGHRGATPAELRRDVFVSGATHRVMLVEQASGPAGFIAWDRIYDLHWAAAGAQVADLYVIPGARGLGIALQLVAAACAEVARDGGRFLRGSAYDRATTRAFYSRIGIVQPGSGEVHLSGRAFRQMASLAGRSARDIARELPRPEWNFDP